jgi:hypothetical protein
MICRECWVVRPSQALHLEPGPRASFNSQNEIANVNLIALAHDCCLGDLPAVHVSAVRALQIRHDKSAVTKEKSRVAFGDVPLRQQQVVTLNPPDVDLGAIECFAALGATLLIHDDGKHSPFLHACRRCRDRLRLTHIASRPQGRGDESASN